MLPAVYPADLFVLRCKGSYYLRRVFLDSGLFAVVKITTVKLMRHWKFKLGTSD